MQIFGMLVTLSGVFLVIRARYVEEKAKRLNQTEPTTESKSSYALLNESDKGDVEEVKITFSVDTDKDDSIFEEDEEMKEKAFKDTQPMLARETELREMS